MTSEREGPESSAPLTIAIVTPTYNRLPLLKRLYESLSLQCDSAFVWVVVDDCSTDGTQQWLAEVTAVSRFEIAVLRNDQNKGKCASLNVAFDSINAEFYLIVDSDDRLDDGAVRTVRAKAMEYAPANDVGAVFFCYRTAGGDLLGAPGGADNEDVVMTRATYDESFGKYDGSVGYFRRVVERYRYPQFGGESYLGPTVLQLMMAPEFSLCFTHDVVGFAEYQADGLSASGRLLRMRNPLGMMTYASLQRQQSRSLSARLQHAVKYHAYRRLAAGGPDCTALGELRGGRGERVPLLLGICLALYWKRKYTPSSTGMSGLAAGASRTHPHKGGASWLRRR